MSAEVSSDCPSPTDPGSGQPSQDAGDGDGGRELGLLPAPNCFLSFRGSCQGAVTRGGHCEYHLRIERTRALLYSEPFDSGSSFAPIDRMMRGNTPIRGLSSGSLYRKPEYVWATPKKALRKPSQKRYKLETPQRALQLEDAVTVDFLAGGGWGVPRRDTGRPVGRPVRGVTNLEALRNRIDQAARGNGHADLSDANSKTLAELFKRSRRTIQRLRRPVSPNYPKGEEVKMQTAASTIAERITRAEQELERQKEVCAEVARQVGITFDDAGVQQAVDKFLDELES